MGEQATAFSTLRQSGVMTQNEARHRLGLPPQRCRACSAGTVMMRLLPTAGRRLEKMGTMRRLATLGLLAVLALGAVAIGFVVGQSSTEEVRVIARSVSDGRIEFGIEHDGSASCRLAGL